MRRSLSAFPNQPGMLLNPEHGRHIPRRRQDRCCHSISRLVVHIELRRRFLLPTHDIIGMMS